MTVCKHLIFVCLALSSLWCVSCDLHLKEDEPCTTKGLNGTCVGIFRCNTAALSYLYANAGFDVVKYNIPDLPDICSYKDNEPVVCCTDCKISKDGDFRDNAIGPLAVITKNDGPIASRTYSVRLLSLPYRTQYFGRYLFRIWEDTPGCHHYENRPEDMVEHTVEVCPAWVEHRRDLVEAIGGGDLSRPALVQSMVRRHGKRLPPFVKQ